MFAMFDLFKKKPSASNNEATANAAPETKPAAIKQGFFAKLKVRAHKGHSWLTQDVRAVFGDQSQRAQLRELLEEKLLQADVGVVTTQSILDAVLDQTVWSEQTDFALFQKAFANELTQRLEAVAKPLALPEQTEPYVILVLGVNGAGKTTTIGKLAAKLQAEGKSVMLAAGDTFRAAAVEQLQTWGERAKVPVVAQGQGADPASVLFDAMQSASAKNMDVLIADTAGRLHTQDHLLDELQKIVRVMKKHDAAAPHEVLLVFDANMGQNVMNQVETFNQVVPITGLAVTKLDGSAKGGVVFALSERFGLPIRWVGVGEAIDDLGELDAASFCEALLQ